MDNNSSREKIQQIFNYLRELNKIKTPPVSDVGQYPWKLEIRKLPRYPSIQFFDAENSANNDGVILRVKRTPETDCPKPPPILHHWIENGWEKISNLEAKYIPVKNFQDNEGKTYSENFQDESGRVSAFNKWISERSTWLEAERPARDANKVYADLFTLQGALDRESEKYQLCIADGNFICRSEFGPINHPILLKKVELSFIPEKQEFVICDGDDEAELYTALLRFHELNGEAVSDSKRKIKEDETHPTGTDKTSEFYKYFISRFFRDGEFFEEKPEAFEKEVPYIFRNPIIILNNKSQGFADAIERLAEAIPQMPKLPEALVRIVGADIEASSPNSYGDIPPQIPTDGKEFPEKKDVDYLLTKPTNREQERVIQKLEATGAVLVQGPPGTGKSHTIANIVGHLLASGKKVIVSSHTSKALRVVREKVVEELKPLCVSVLDNDQESKAQLADSINKIVNYHSRTDVPTLEREISQLSEHRRALKAQLETLNKEALEVRKNEYNSIVYQGESISPSDAGKIIHSNEASLEIISAPVKINSPIPLDEEELLKLYKSNVDISPEEESILAGEIPNVDDLLTATQVKELAKLISDLQSSDLEDGIHFWKSSNTGVEKLEKILVDITNLRNIFNAEKWLHECVESSFHVHNKKDDGWHIFLQQITNLNEKIKKYQIAENEHLPELDDSHTYDIAQDIYLHVASGKSLGALQLLLKPSWKQFIATARVLSGQPQTIDHFYSIVCHLEIKKVRRELNIRWERQIVSLGGNKLPNNSPERTAISYAELIKQAISWREQWNSICTELASLGFDYQKLWSDTRQLLAGKSNTDQINALSFKLLDFINARIKWLKHQALSQKVSHATVQLSKFSPSDAGKFLVVGLQDALRSLDCDAYDRYFSVVLDLTTKKQLYALRIGLIKKLELSAPTWASSIRTRTGVHGKSLPPENLIFAWKVRQLNEILNLRLKADYAKLQEEISKTKKQIELVTSQYVEKLSWKYQKIKTTQSSWQSLQGWLGVQKRLSKTGTGKRDAAFLKESRRLIKEARSAVPVWIMPLSKISENFDLGNTKFDVLILDEASQSDINALIAFAIADQVIVVGDNEQVTPYAVGMELNKVQALIEELLKGIPNAVLYDGKTSIYDLAQQAFGETIRLVEHFRCVPDIIRFSNQLSYHGEIRPLREASSSPHRLHTISHRVQGSRSDNGKTNLAEAEEIASLICAMIELPECQLNDEGKKISFGVISLLGDEQAYLIESILKENINPTVYQERKILCGNSSQFQGDERDVVFISLVDSAEGVPLRIKQTADFKKICNVAASRARNQLWVVHSLDPQNELKPGDLRLRLIQHVENPQASEILTNEANKFAESPFEKSVQADLIREGYKIIPQWKVGAYRIDMVVVGNDKKIAVECDGEKFHSHDKLEEDIYRQATLERLGWQFIRIRGSEYYKNPILSMNKVFAKLEVLGVEKLGGVNSQPSEERSTDQGKDNVLRRAFEIREEWKAKKDPRV